MKKHVIRRFLAQLLSLLGYFQDFKNHKKISDRIHCYCCSRLLLNGSNKVSSDYIYIFKDLYVPFHMKLESVTGWNKDIEYYHK